MDCPSGPFFYSRSVSGPRGQQLCLGCPGQGWGPAVQVAWAGFASTPAGERGSAPQELSTVFTVSFTLSSQVSWEDAGARALCDGQSACVLGPSPLPAAWAPSPPPADPRLPLGCPSMSLLGVFCRGSCLGGRRPCGFGVPLSSRHGSWAVVCPPRGWRAAHCPPWALGGETLRGQLADGPGQSAVRTRDPPWHRGAHVCALRPRPPAVGTAACPSRPILDSRVLSFGVL